MKGADQCHEGLMNAVTHEYFGVDMENIRKIASEELPKIKKKVAELRSVLK